MYQFLSYQSCTSILPIDTDIEVEQASNWIYRKIWPFSLCSHHIVNQLFFQNWILPWLSKYSYSTNPMLVMLLTSLWKGAFHKVLFQKNFLLYNHIFVWNWVDWKVINSQNKVFLTITDFRTCSKAIKNISRLLLETFPNE